MSTFAAFKLEDARSINHSHCGSLHRYWPSFNAHAQCDKSHTITTHGFINSPNKLASAIKQWTQTFRNLALWSVGTYNRANSTRVASRLAGHSAVMISIGIKTAPVVRRRFSWMIGYKCVMSRCSWRLVSYVCGEMFLILFQQSLRRHRTWHDTFSSFITYANLNFVILK